MAANKSIRTTSSTTQRRAPAGVMVPRPVNGVQYANPYSVRYNAGYSQPQRRPAPRKPQEKPPVQKNRRKERDYFFIMRRGVCFFIMLLALVWVGVIALNYLGIMPQYTSYLVAPDLTPLDEREGVETGETDEEGNAIVEEYVDKSVYISVTDPVFGILKKLAGLDMKDDAGNSMSPFYDSFSPAISGSTETDTDEEENDGGENKEDIVAEAAGETEDEETTDGEENTDGEEATDGEEGAAEEETAKEDTSIKFGYVSANTDIDPEARAQDSMGSIASMAFDYAPAVLIVGAVFALIIFILAFLSLFGRRIFKGFGIMSVIMLLGGIATLIAGMAAMGNYMGYPAFDAEGTVVSVIDFSKISDFIFGVFSGAPETALDPEVDAMPLKLVAGYGLIALVVIPVIMVILSIFARKKVPYSIFDK